MLVNPSRTVSVSSRVGAVTPGPSRSTTLFWYSSAVSRRSDAAAGTNGPTDAGLVPGAPPGAAPPVADPRVPLPPGPLWAPPAGAAPSPSGPPSIAPVHDIAASVTPSVMSRPCLVIAHLHG